MGALFLKFGFILLAALVVIFVTKKAGDYLRGRAIERLFQGRERKTKAAFYQAYYADTGISEDTVIRVLSDLEYNLLCDLSRMLPSDNFSGNLHFFMEEDEFLGVSITESLESEFSIEISDDEARKAHTIDDIIRLVWAKVQAA